MLAVPPTRRTGRFSPGRTASVALAKHGGRGPYRWEYRYDGIWRGFSTAVPGSVKAKQWITRSLPAYPTPVAVGIGFAPEGCSSVFRQAVPHSAAYRPALNTM